MANTRVETYKGDRTYEQGLRAMQSQGWKVVDHQIRSRRWKWTTGFLTDDTIHVVTWELDPQAYVQSRQRGGAPPRPDLP